MPVLHNVRPLACKDCVILGKWLLELAMGGRTRGLAVVIRMADGTEETVFTGAYRARASNAMTAAAKMYLSASRAIESTERREEG